MRPDLNQFTINGFDWWKTWKIGTLDNSSGGLLEAPKVKESLSHDWPEENGIEIDLSTQTYYGRELTFKCFILCENISPKANNKLFWKNYKGFLAQWFKPGLQDLYSIQQDVHYYVYYKSASNFEKVTPISGTHLIYCTFNITFAEQTPSFWQQSPTIPIKVGGKTIIVNGQIVVV